MLQGCFMAMQIKLIVVVGTRLNSYYTSKTTYIISIAYSKHQRSTHIIPGMLQIRTSLSHQYALIWYIHI